jgi:DNA ligase (NAD+)
MDTKRLQELEEFYLQAKEAYYTGEAIISDDEFDRLEEELREAGSGVVEVVGYSDRNLKHQHLSPMLSLAKAQASLDGTLPMDQMNSWFSTYSEDTEFEATPKYDGNAVNLVYKKGRLHQGITRGDKAKGKDVTSKLIKKVPHILQGITGDVEVRGEAVIPTEIFFSKYYGDLTPHNYKNPRNFVAGVLGRDETDPSLLEEIEFVAVEVRIHDGDYDYPTNTQDWLKTQGFNTNTSYFISFKASEFVDTYNKMKTYRESLSPFQLDGFVIKAPEKIRKSLGEKGHHPNWAIAVKFPPKETVTTIRGFKWNIGTSGGITPIAQLEPVDLDGTTIKNVAAFNYGYIMREKIFPGAKVVIAKSGDIIPQIMKVIETGDESQFQAPTHCPSCQQKLVVEGIHIFCENEECEGKMFKKFLVGIRTLKLEKFGSVTCKDLYNAGFHSVMDIFNPAKFNKETLIASGLFKEGKTLNSLIAEVEKVKIVPHYIAIISLGFDGIGNTGAKQISRMITGLPYSFSGLEKKVVAGFETGTSKRNKVEAFISLLESRGIQIEKEVDSINGIGFEITGSPKDSGFKVKSDLIKFLASKGYVHKSLKESKYLLTDSMSSTSSKMEDARKRGVIIHTYESFIEMIQQA